ncbi:peptidase S8/S53 domain-containing protein [Rhypophila decipiens]|uniref:Peptidase S8/S53 domain-containing protein n=1 Tax=Rhypophila decipiens TaxID=261697 RepID=A0AAN6Y3W7_9PEZI|nr:peptidase S8/S53 domain-containing protein [Rhypophila decipiens]
MDSAEATDSPGVTIGVNGHTITPESQMPGGDLFNESASSNYILVQLTDLPTVDQEKELHELHVQFCSVIPPTSWLAKYEPSDLSPVRDLPFVVYANPYHESLSLNPAWLDQLMEERGPQGLVGAPGTPTTAAPAELHDVVIMLHARARTPEEMLNYLVSDLGIPKDRLFLEIMSLKGSLAASEILRISKMDDVKSIHPEPRVESFSHLVYHTIRATLPEARGNFMEVVEDGDHTGPAPMQVDEDFDGDDEIITIADSGLDDGRIQKGPNDMMDLHPFFKDRIILLDARSNGTGLDFKGNFITRAGKTDDWTGHGTYVAGIALGSYGELQASPAIQALGSRLDGVAPKASLVMQAIMGCPSWDATTRRYRGPPVQLKPENFAVAKVYLDPFYGYPANYLATGVPGSTVPIPDPNSTVKYRWRARIHSNSTGGIPTQTSHGYAPGGTRLDEMLYRLPDYLLLYAAGNEGDDPDVVQHFPDGQITGSASAKNVLTVGACFNDQYVRVRNPPPGPLWNAYRSQARGGEMVESRHVPRFSCRGPVASTNPSAPYRDIIKPDIVAPGVAIYSALSQAVLEGVPRKRAGVAPEPGDTYCKFGTGTSMAVPVVAGAAALLRQALRRRNCPDPSAALLKALIINGAVDLSRYRPKGAVWPGNPTTNGGANLLTKDDMEPAPSNAQGFGRLNIADSLENVTDTTHCGWTDIKFGSVEALQPDQTPPAEHIYPGDIAPPPAHQLHSHVANLKVTLAWNDLQGEGLQNRLALRIEFPDPRFNIAVGPGGDARLARMANNNVQKLEVRNIKLSAGLAFQARIFVRADNINVDVVRGVKVAQGYAICWKIWYSVEGTP